MGRASPRIIDIPSSFTPRSEVEGEPIHFNEHRQTNSGGRENQTIRRSGIIPEFLPEFLSEQNKQKNNELYD